MPIDFAHGQSRQVVKFDSFHASTQLPDGEYEGVVDPTIDYQLGRNGAARKWMLVNITKTPEGAEKFLGINTAVWEQADGSKKARKG